MTNENSNPYRPSSTEELLKAELEVLKAENEKLKAEIESLMEDSESEVVRNFGKLTLCGYKRENGKLVTSFQFGKTVDFTLVYSEDSTFPWNPSEEYEIVARKVSKAK
jgi:hypothetical protein